jgi:protein TonB
MATTTRTTTARLLPAAAGMLAMCLPLHAQQAEQASPTAATAAVTPSAAKAAPEKKAAAVIPRKVMSSWRAALATHLNQHKRYPGSGAGTSTIAFSIDRSGKCYRRVCSPAPGMPASTPKPSRWRAEPVRCPSRQRASEATT